MSCIPSNLLQGKDKCPEVQSTLITVEKTLQSAFQQDLNTALSATEKSSLMDSLYSDEMMAGLSIVTVAEPQSSFASMESPHQVPF
jgi:hypothetical protein